MDTNDSARRKRTIGTLAATAMGLAAIVGGCTSKDTDRDYDEIVPGERVEVWSDEGSGYAYGVVDTDRGHRLTVYRNDVPLERMTAEGAIRFVEEAGSYHPTVSGDRYNVTLSVPRGTAFDLERVGESTERFGGLGFEPTTQATRDGRALDVYTVTLDANDDSFVAYLHER